jgi:dolichyl-phosphate beta-glucosyltransferase
VSVPALSVVIPAFDEEALIEASVREVLEVLGSQREIEVLVVDDGSRDRTPDRVRAIAEDDPRVRLLRHEPNRGKGFAVRRGMALARAPRVLFTDADLSTPLVELARLEAEIDGGAAVAIASRGLPDSRVELHQPWHRERMGKTFNLIIRLAGIRGIRDTQCGFKLFRADAAARILPLARIDGFAFDVELLYLARKLGYEVREVPTRWVNRPESRVRILADSAAMLAELVRIRAGDVLGTYRGPFDA